jgi:hypothetical protein
MGIEIGFCSLEIAQRFDAGFTDRIPAKPRQGRQTDSFVPVGLFPWQEMVSNQGRRSIAALLSALKAEMDQFAQIAA